MLKYVKRDIDKLPNCVRSYVRSVALSKKDDFVKIVRHCGYEVFVWTADLPVEIAILP